MSIKLGSYYINDEGQASQLIPLPDVDGIEQPFLTWGYGAQPSPGVGAWISTPNLHDAPFNVPAEATAVRLYIKAKAKTISWTSVDSLGDIQVAVKDPGSAFSVNECIHATAAQKGASDLPAEQISHVPVDVTIGEDGQVNIFHYPSIIGYANVDLIVYLAGYWALDPAPGPEVPDPVVENV
ncbi:hypothetical protein [Pseudomonas donghuensis]|uniref:hypothetical protein n=1 Tax=Pseudomonas donghuensis TaxID=1163398 RepID=UPI0020C1E3E5|nr:hypothetical protein [Pseudomonas donghuensis]MCP6695841.1 hypothetical protein [Pseudomonas donghuensis]